MNLYIEYLHKLLMLICSNLYTLLLTLISTAALQVDVRSGSMVLVGKRSFLY